MNLVLGLSALLGFVLSLGVHVLALRGIDVSAQVPWVWILHIGIFAVFMPLVFAIRKTSRSTPTAALWAGLPRWAVVVGGALIAYAVVNFVLFAVFSEGGGPSIRAGKFVLESHGRFIRELTSTEYTAFKANELRGFSGHWLIFYYAPFVYFVFGPKSRQSVGPDAR